MLYAFFTLILIGLASGALAHYKNRNEILWFFAGLFFNIFALAVIFFLPHKYNYSSQSNQQAKSVHCPYCGDTVFIDGAGFWKCSNCGNVFEYDEDENVVKSEDALAPVVRLLISLFAKISKADGVVTKEEVKKVDSIVKAELQPSDIQLKKIRDAFNTAKNTNEDYKSIVHQLYELLHEEPNVLRGILAYLLDISTIDGHLHPEQEKIINYAADCFNLKNEYQETKSQYAIDLDECYKVLGCTKDDSTETIKRKYRELVKKYHPDRFMSQNLPHEFMEVANKKLDDIKKAYEKIIQIRKEARRNSILDPRF